MTTRRSICLDSEQIPLRVALLLFLFLVWEMFRGRAKLLLVALVFLAVYSTQSSYALPQPYWVVDPSINPAANDGNNGFTSNTAWATLLKVRDPTPYHISFPAGTVINLVGHFHCDTGGLNATIHDPPLFGTQAQPIIITSGGGIGATFDGDGGSGNNQLLFAGGEYWVIVSNISFINGASHGCSESVGAHDILYVNNVFSNSEILFQSLNCSNIVFRANSCYYPPGFMNGVGPGGSCPPGDLGGHGVTFGEFYNSPKDGTQNIIVESNLFMGGCHDALSIYGSNCVDRYNMFVGVPWSSALVNGWAACIPFTFGSGTYWGTNIYASGRDIEVGGLNGSNILSEHEILLGGGAAPDGPGNYTCSGANNIFRKSVVIGSAGNAVQWYGKGGGAPCSNNAAYDITTGWNGWMQYFNVTNGAPVYEPYAVWQNTLSAANIAGGGNFAFNIVDYYSYSNSWRFAEGSATDIAWMAGCLTNTINPQWVNPNYNPSNFTLNPVMPDVHIQPTSPCASAGQYITTANGGGSGTVLIVNSNAALFYSGNVTACGYTISNDFVQFQGTTATAQILSVSGQTITLANSLTWSANQPLSIPFALPGPDIGAMGVETQNPSVNGVGTSSALNFNGAGTGYPTLNGAGPQ